MVVLRFFIALRIVRIMPMAWVRSHDNGATWSEPTPCIDFGDKKRDDNLNEIYVGSISSDPNHPHFGEGFHVSGLLPVGRISCVTTCTIKIWPPFSVFPIITGWPWMALI